MANTITIHALSSMPAEHIRPWRTVLAASLAHDLLGQPLPTLEQVHTPGTTTGLDSRRLFWRAAEPDGTVNGVAALRLFTPRDRRLWPRWSCTSTLTGAAVTSARDCWHRPSSPPGWRTGAA